MTGDLQDAAADLVVGTRPYRPHYIVQYRDPVGDQFDWDRRLT